MRAILLAAAAVAWWAGAAFGQNLPVSVTGWNRDIVVEARATAPFTAAAQAFDVPNAYAYYENGLAGGTKGLPQGGMFTSASDAGTTIQLQPYEASNALFMDAAGPTGTLTLLPAAQRPYNTLVIIASSANAQATSAGTVVVNFTDGTSSSALPFNAFDWFFVTTNNAIVDLGRVSIGTGAFQDTSAGNPRLYQTTIDLAASGQNNKTVQSLTFTKPANAGTTVVVAISGAVNSTTPGVCCANTGSCSITAPLACSGSFNSVATVCTPGICPQPIACCFASGTCTPLQASVCISQNGTGQGAGSVCNPNPCPQPGACCFANGTCSSLLSATCASAGGSFTAPSSVCSPNPCPQLPWACCLADGSCLTRTSAGCATVGGDWRPAATCAATQCPPPNLLVNGGAEAGDMSGWMVDLNGGNGWLAAGETTHSGNNAFATSYGLATRHQTVDLLGAGFTAELLDAAPPIAMSEWIGTRFDQAGQYFVRFELLDASMTVVQFFEHGTQDVPIQIPSMTAYFQEAMTFTGYGPGVRFLNVIDGGRDQSTWAGNYGTHFDDALAAVVLARACCAGSTCSTQDMAACTTAGGTPQSAGTSCNPSPCAVGGGGGVCCRGSTCNASVTQAACTTSGVIAGAAFVPGAPACNSTSSVTSPCCHADYNKLAGVTLQDVFDFLNDWFAGSPYANVGGNGTGGGLVVQNVFDFLNDWFGGGC